MEETIEIKTLMKILNPFTEYCEDVRGDWNGFDGRVLLRRWREILKELEESCK